MTLTIPYREKALKAATPTNVLTVWAIMGVVWLVRATAMRRMDVVSAVAVTSSRRVARTPRRKDVSVTND